jgi:hypothetical protein
MSASSAPLPRAAASGRLGPLRAGFLLLTALAAADLVHTLFFRGGGAVLASPRPPPPRTLAAAATRAASPPPAPRSSPPPPPLPQSTPPEAASAASAAAAVDAPLPPFYEPGYTPRPGADAARLWRSTAAQAAIHAAQNPADCVGASYMRLEPVPSGFGSNIHVITAYLALAMNRGEVLVLHPAFGGGWVRGPYCEGRVSYECFFQPLSGCAPEGAPPRGARVRDVSGKDVMHEIPTAWHDAFKARAGRTAPDTETLDVKYWCARGALLQQHARVHLPQNPLCSISLPHASPSRTLCSSHALACLLACLLPRWRAQGAAYVMRLNARTSAELSARRRALAPGVPLPLPAGAYAAHVRHGDKHQEMTLFNFDKFARGIALAAAAAAAASAGNVSRPLTVFVSTEDPSVIDDALALAARSPGEWRVLHVPHARDNAATLTAAERGAGETLNSLLNLLVALEATHFVGQLGSNWCRLMDELRRVWVGARPACCTPYIEVGCDADECPASTLNWR